LFFLLFESCVEQPYSLGYNRIFEMSLLAAALSRNSALTQLEWVASLIFGVFLSCSRIEWLVKSLPQLYLRYFTPGRCSSCQHLVGNPQVFLVDFLVGFLLLIFEMICSLSNNQIRDISLLTDALAKNTTLANLKLEAYL
jgi:hypothetical protein